jgi:hypothetical protein
MLRGRGFPRNTTTSEHDMPSAKCNNTGREVSVPPRCHMHHITNIPLIRMMTIIIAQII